MKERATQVSPVRDLIAERMRITAEKCPFMQWQEAVIMPDHVHALIRMEGGYQRLGDVIGGFKAAVSREMPAHWVPDNVRIWHRNYYESIVRTPDAARRIAEYIRMNPWRCVQQLGDGLRGMGNPALWNLPKLAVLASRPNRDAPVRIPDIPDAPAYLSGFHSPLEKGVFAELLQARRNVIWCPAWGLERSARVPGVREALEQNRILILEMPRTGDTCVASDTCVAPSQAAAEQRNRFVLENADSRWLPYITPGGMLDRLVRATPVSPSPSQATPVSPASPQQPHPNTPQQATP
jgi:REP element-mobilizing transposase RayT